MKKMSVILSAVAASMISSVALAEGPSVWTCKSSLVQVKETVSYLGEGNSCANQDLVAISLAMGGATAFDNSVNTVFFLMTKNMNKYDANNTLIQSGLSGTNGAGGKFKLTMSDIKVENTVPYPKVTATGTLDFKHGYFEVTNEKLNCSMGGNSP